MPCYFCEKEPREAVFGYWCQSCRELKNICNVYGFKRSLEILKKCCIRNEEQLEKKILQKKTELDTIEEEKKPVTRSQYKNQGRTG